MKTFKNTLALLLAATALLASLAGCASTPSGSTAESAPSAASSAIEQSETGTEREITDMAGRSHTIPAEVTAVYSTDPVGMIALYTLAPELMVGLNYTLTEAEAAYILPEVATLPVLGMRDSLNTEAVLNAGAQLVLAIGKLDGGAQEDANTLQEKLGVPVVMANGSFTSIPEMYRFLGAVLGLEERAETLATYAEALFAKVEAAEIAEEERVTFYYGNGADSLETVLVDSSGSLEFELAGGVNSAAITVEELQSGRAQISAEHLLTFMPDVVFLNGEPKSDVSAASAVEDFLSHPEYATIPAVQNGRVYAIPTSPFAWVERPQAANRLIGLLWTAQTLYPETYGYDLEAEVQAFYSEFYHVTLTAEQVAGLLAG